MSADRDPLSTHSAVFLLHILLEAPLIVQGFWYPQSLPFSGMDVTACWLAKLLSAMSLGTCLTSVFCYSLPYYFPGKRAVAIGLSLYHAVVSIILFQSSVSASSTSSSGATIADVWAILHGIVGVWFGLWWVWVRANPPLFYVYYPQPQPPLPPAPAPTQNVQNPQVGSRRRRGRK